MGLFSKNSFTPFLCTVVQKGFCEVVDFKFFGESRMDAFCWIMYFYGVLFFRFLLVIRVFTCRVATFALIRDFLCYSRNLRLFCQN